MGMTKSLLERLAEQMKSGQEEMKARQEDLKAGQEEIKARQEEMKAGQKEMKAGQEEFKKNIFEGLKKQTSKGHEESKGAFMPSLTTIKLLTFDRKTSWQVHKTQFKMVAEANGWNSRVKVFHLAASLRGDAADILETLPEKQRNDFQALSGGLELLFGGKCT
ncbi:uncharacterized protein NPIL_505231 [Nephila pilipes]|uniref:Uncharacterized protein n=1 Tax=Nephila pilipes TaxID=299642 RepID=A0A8X6MQW1_NEPPI|nr:uncharacterized protein NPIL_505231 [Nephila pilipes]